MSSLTTPAAAAGQGQKKQTPASGGFQQGGSCEGFGEDLAAIAPHFAQAFKRPPIEGGLDRDDILICHPPGQAER
jgi:hypothetical protein